MAAYADGIGPDKGIIAPAPGGIIRFTTDFVKRCVLFHGLAFCLTPCGMDRTTFTPNTRTSVYNILLRSSILNTLCWCACLLKRSDAHSTEGTALIALQGAQRGPAGAPVHLPQRARVHREQPRKHHVRVRHRQYRAAHFICSAHEQVLQNVKQSDVWCPARARGTCWLRRYELYFQELDIDGAFADYVESEKFYFRERRQNAVFPRRQVRTVITAACRLDGECVMLCLHAGCMQQLPPHQATDADCHVLCIVVAGLPTGQHGHKCQRNSVERVY